MDVIQMAGVLTLDRLYTRTLDECDIIARVNDGVVVTDNHDVMRLLEVLAPAGNGVLQFTALGRRRQVGNDNQDAVLDNSRFGLIHDALNLSIVTDNHDTIVLHIGALWNFFFVNYGNRFNLCSVNLFRLLGMLFAAILFIAFCHNLLILN